MAAPMRAICARVSALSKSVCGGCRVLDGFRSQGFNYAVRRTLFSDEILGIEGYKKHRSYTVERMGSMKGAFRGKMEQYLAQSEQSTVFSDDLKTLLSIGETEEDVQLALRMLKAYIGQETLRFNTFQFGPVLMRMLHILELPQIALDVYNDQAFTSLFDQVSSCLNLLDNLYVNKCYDDVINVFPRIQERFSGGERFPRDCLTLYVASSLHKDSSESYRAMLSTLSEFQKSGLAPPDKACSIAAYTALVNKDPKVAIELASSVHRPDGPGPLNIRAQAFAALDRPEDSLSLVTTVMYKDVPSYVTIRPDIFSETLDVIGEAVTRHDKSDLSTKYDIVCKDLTRIGHVNHQGLREYLLQPVARRKPMKAGFKSRPRSPTDGYQRAGNVVTRYRSGLTDE